MSKLEVYLALGYRVRSQRINISAMLLIIIGDYSKAAASQTIIAKEAFYS